VPRSRPTPCRSVRVRFEWEYPSTSRTVDLFTDVNGVARAYADPSLLVMGGRVNVAASLPATQGAATSSIVRRSWFIPTDRIGYTATTISSGYPAPISSSRRRRRAQPHGAPVVGSRYVHVGFPSPTSTHARCRPTTKAPRATAQRRNRDDRLPRHRPREHGGRRCLPFFLRVVRAAEHHRFHDLGGVDVAPAPNSKVTVSDHLPRSARTPIAGAPVDFLWRFRSARCSAPRTRTPRASLAPPATSNARREATRCQSAARRSREAATRPDDVVHPALAVLPRPAEWPRPRPSSTASTTYSQRRRRARVARLPVSYSGARICYLILSFFAEL